MPDERGNARADEETETSLHAYKDGRTDQIEGDVEKFLSNDPKQLQQDKIADDDEDAGMPAHDKA